MGLPETPPLITLNVSPVSSVKFGDIENTVPPLPPVDVTGTKDVIVLFLVNVEEDTASVTVNVEYEIVKE